MYYRRGGQSVVANSSRRADPVFSATKIPNKNLKASFFYEGPWIAHASLKSSFPSVGGMGDGRSLARVSYMREL